MSPGFSQHLLYSRSTSSLPLVKNVRMFMNFTQYKYEKQNKKRLTWRQMARLFVHNGIKEFKAQLQYSFAIFS